MAIIASTSEQALLIQSGRILVSCLLSLEKILRAGVTAEEVNDFAHHFILRHEAQPAFLGYSGFPHSICVSVNQEVVHGLAEKKTFMSGDLVSLDLGVDFKGFFTDAARTFLITDTGIHHESGTEFLRTMDADFFKQNFSGQMNFGKPSFFGANQATATTKDKLNLIQATYLGLEFGLKSLHPRAKVGDVGQAVNDWIKTFGYGNVTALGGHGVGRAVHEKPYISNKGKKGEGARLVENLVLAIEPMITMSDGRNVKFVADNKFNWDVVVTGDNSLACHFEDTAILTKKGMKIITRVDSDQILE
jgi:methionyl aminopeptidase